MTVGASDVLPITHSWRKPDNPDAKEGWIWMRRSKRRIMGLMAALLVGTVLTACGDGGSGATAGSGDTLRVGVSQGPDSLDPAMAVSEQLSQRFGLWGLYDRLFTLGPAGEVKGMLAKEWNYSQDGLTLTLNLRDGVKFHDGTPLDAEAVKANLDRYRTLTSPLVKARMGVVTEVMVTAPLQVDLTLTSPVPHVPNVLAEAAGYIINPKALKDGSNLDLETFGSGPYKLTSFKPGTSLVMERSEDPYWDEEAGKFKRIEYTGFADFKAMENATNTGQIDVVQFLPEYAEAVKNAPGMRIEYFDQGIGHEFIFNTSVAPLDDPLVRQAMNYAIDRNTITETFFPKSFPRWQYGREGLPGYDPEVGSTYSYDPAKAKELLVQAGHPDGVNLGEVLVSASTVTGLNDLLERQLNEAGFTLTMTKTDPYQINTIFAEGKHAANLGFVTSATSPFTHLAYRFGPGPRNPGGTTAEYGEIVNGMTNKNSDEENAALFAKADRYVVENAWSLPIVRFASPWVMKENLRGLDQNSDYASSHGPIDMRYAYFEE
ncbi:ABC transporter substrate-binding protein [Rhodococcus koreensis]|uniref:ABC transporter substrate-binding protein n=1 Tax=Rhodococcus koreensis TaxID=99653 RepID=UPI0036DBE648